ncbi:hypothetical protein D3C86_1328130 [compost metagenome]
MVPLLFSDSVPVNRILIKSVKWISATTTFFAFLKKPQRFLFSIVSKPSAEFTSMRFNKFFPPFSTTLSRESWISTYSTCSLKSRRSNEVSEISLLVSGPKNLKQVLFSGFLQETTSNTAIKNNQLFRMISFFIVKCIPDSIFDVIRFSPM